MNFGHIEREDDTYDISKIENMVILWCCNSVTGFQQGSLTKIISVILKLLKIAYTFFSTRTRRMIQVTQEDLDPTQTAMTRVKNV